MVEELQELQKLGWKIIVWTVRHKVRDVKKWLKSYNIPHDYVNENPWSPTKDKARKMYADVYLDDRAVSFNGDTTGLASKINSFKVWHRKNPITRH